MGGTQFDLMDVLVLDSILVICKFSNSIFFIPFYLVFLIQHQEPLNGYQPRDITPRWSEDEDIRQNKMSNHSTFFLMFGLTF